MAKSVREELAEELDNAMLRLQSHHVQPSAGMALAIARHRAKPDPLPALLALLKAALKVQYITFAGDGCAVTQMLSALAACEWITTEDA